MARSVVCCLPNGSVEALKVFEQRNDMIRMIFQVYCSDNFGQELGGGRCNDPEERLRTSELKQVDVDGVREFEN